MTFAARLRAVQKKKESLLCVGLDVDPRKIPPHLRSNPDGVYSFLQSIIDSTFDLVCAYKPNLAFFEAMGPSGLEVLRKTLAFIPGNVVTIGDGKRGDIGNTAEQYARFLFDDLNFDAVTLHPYMGHDSVEPFLNRPGKGAFLLALTSNAGSKDFQTKKLGSRPLYEAVVLASRSWSHGSSLGYVVGATHPSQLRNVRKLVPGAPILIPGVGAQGGDLASSVKYGCSASGDLAIINASRSVLYASGGRDFAARARREAERLKEDIERIREATRTGRNG